MLFSFAIVAIGVETMVCAHVASHSLGPRYEVVPTIPWLPAIPAAAYAVGTIWVLCGIGLLFRSTALASSLTLGALMLLFALAFDAPKRPNVMNAGWRTVVFEPLAIASLVGLLPDRMPFRNGYTRQAATFWHLLSSFLVSPTFKCSL